MCGPQTILIHIGVNSGFNVLAAVVVHDDYSVKFWSVVVIVESMLQF